MDQHSRSSLPFKESIYLSLDDILVIHTDQIERYGGSHGIRDIGLLESALYRPQATFGGQDLYESLPEKATVLVHSLLLNHAFVDGNKRTAITALLVFLELNDLPLHVTQQELIEAALAIENKSWDKKDIVLWLKKNSHQR